MRIRRVAVSTVAVVALALGALVVTGNRAGPGYTPGLRKPLALRDASLTHEESRFAGARGTPLFAQAWLPPQGVEPRGALVVMHGLKDHSDRYADLAEQLAQGGLAVHAFDLRGHGNSEGDRVWVEAFDDYVSDLDGFVRTVQARHAGKPVFVLGHSMGGAISTLAVLDKKTPVAGLILSAPALKAGKEVNAALIWVTGVINAIAPNAKVLALPEEAFSRDAAVRAAMKTDPLIAPGAGPARTAKELLGALSSITARMEGVDVPLLILHGSADVITNPEGSKELAARAVSGDKTLKLYPELVHDLLHEPERAQVAGDIAAWIDQRAPRAPAPVVEGTATTPAP